MLVVCHLPYLILATLVIHVEPSSSVSLAWIYLLTLVYFNSLEDRRSETSSEGHNQTTTLLLIELAFVKLNHPLPY